MIKKILFSLFIGFFAGAFAQNGSVCIQVFNDLNGDGIPDEGEPGVEGVGIIVTNAPASFPFELPYSAATDASGNFCFTGLDNGQYTFGVEVPEGWEISGDPFFTVEITDEAPTYSSRRALSNTMWAPQHGGSNFTLYHDRARNMLMLKGSNPLNTGEIIIYDISGKSLVTQDLYGQEATIDVSGLTSGVYIAKIRSGSVSQAVKFIKQ